MATHAVHADCQQQGKHALKNTHFEPAKEKASLVSRLEARWVLALESVSSGIRACMSLIPLCVSEYRLGVFELVVFPCVQQRTVACASGIQPVVSNVARSVEG